MLKYSNTNVNKIKYKPKFKRFKLSQFISKHTLTISIVVSILFATVIYGSQSMYNHYTDKSKQDSVVAIVYSNHINPTSSPTPIITPTVTMLPNKTTEVSRGGFTRIDDRKVIVEAVVKDKVDFEYVDSFIGTITQYTLAFSECSKLPSDKYFGIGASGLRVVEGVSVAMGKQIPFHTKIRVEGFDQVFINHDSGNGVGWNGVDIFTNNKKQALKFGRQARKVYIIEWGSKKSKK